MSGDWREAYRHGMFVIWPPDDVRAAVNVLRQRYDPRSAAICEAHITLTQPLLTTLDAGDWRRIAETVAAQPTFDIEFGPVNTFLPYPCVYLEIRPGCAVLELRAALHALGHFDLSLPHTDDFVPHMTIADASLAPDDIAALALELQDGAPRGQFPCTEVAYVAPDARFRFEVARRFSLAG
jgi:2'-5' RNA ligase